MRLAPITSRGGILDFVLSGHKKVSEAPTLSDLEQLAERDNIDLEWLLEQERHTLYKAVDTRGNVYLVENPSTLRRNPTTGAIIRHLPKLQLTCSEAMKQSGGAKADSDSSPVSQGQRF